MGKVEDRLARERLEASLRGGSHISPGKMTTKTHRGRKREMGAYSPGLDPI